MNTCRYPVQILIIFVIAHGFRMVRGKPSSGQDGTFPTSQQKGTGARLPSKTLEEMKNECKISAGERIGWWNLLNGAIDNFIREYERRHNANITRINRHLRTADFLILNHDNGFSKSYFLDFDYQRDGTKDTVTSSVVVKLPELCLINWIGKSLMLKDKERYLFERALPMMYQSLSDEKFSPTLYSSAESGMLILENVHTEDWVYNIPYSGIHSEEEYTAVIEALAQFHALSISQLSEDVYSSLDSLTAVKELAENAIVSFSTMESRARYCERWRELLPSTLQKDVERMTRNLRPTMESVYSRSVNGFNVVLQGAVDFRSIVFQLDDELESITKCKFIDFRFSRLGSPVLDLMPYLLGSVDFNVFTSEENADSLIELYLTELHTSLAKLNHSSEYDRAMLYADLRYYKSYFIYFLLYDEPLVQNTPPESPEEILQLRLDTLSSKPCASFVESWMNIFSKW